MNFNMVKILNDIESLFFPDACLGCFNTLLTNEKLICTDCRHQLPLTNYHHYRENPVEKIFYGRIPLERATAFLSYRSAGSVRNLIHQLKYKGHEEVGTFLGSWLGQELSKINSYQKTDIVLPVPLHARRLRKRGYNQAAKFGKQLATALDASYIDTVLYRTVNSTTQTFKNRLMRWHHKQALFAATNKELLVNKHVLLVDDVVTTGATLEACANTIKDIPGIKISIATMAFTE
jgi:competence protein ComFC